MVRQKKDRAARELANAHYAVDPGIMVIFRLKGPADRESDPQEPIKLLEINSNSAAVGIRPVFFGADENSPFPSGIVDIAPGEFDDIRAGRLALPNNWIIGDKYPRPAAKTVS